MSECYDLILKLRAIRDFRPDPISDEHMKTILEAARWTGSAKNRQDWAFVVLVDPDQKARVAECGSFTLPLSSAPTGIAIVEEEGGYEFDSGRLAQNIMLAAAAIGVASCPVTLHDDASASEVLGLGFGQRCRFAIALGYPAPHAAPRRFGGRKPLEALVHRDRY
jgi:nitroreductase